MQITHQSFFIIHLLSSHCHVVSLKTGFVLEEIWCVLSGVIHNTDHLTNKLTHACYKHVYTKKS